MRVNETQLRDVFDTNLEESSLVRHIQAATVIVDEISTKADLPSKRLELIELYLAAHYATVQDPRVSSESVGSTSYTYDRTEYLEMAVSLDPTGIVDGNDDDFHISVSDV